MLAFEETRHATTATVVIKGLTFNEKEVPLTQLPQIVDIVVFKNTISRFNSAAN